MALAADLLDLKICQTILNTYHSQRSVIDIFSSRYYFSLLIITIDITIDNNSIQQNIGIEWKQGKPGQKNKTLNSYSQYLSELYLSEHPKQNEFSCE